MAASQLSCLLLLVCVLPAVEPCLQCDRVIKYLHDDFIDKLTGDTLQDQADIKDIIDHAYVTYKETSNRFHGVIDPTTMYRARTEYQSEFERFWKDEHSSYIKWEIIMIVVKGRQILEKHLKIFDGEGLCPNKCGLLYQTLINCTSCQYELHTCLSTTYPKSCGEHHMLMEEGGEVVLNCYLSWHSLITGQVEYHYYWRPQNVGSQTFSLVSSFETLVVTTESKIVLNQLQVDEAGLYLCLLKDKHGTVFSQIKFNLTIYPLLRTSPVPIPTMLSFPVDYDAKPTWVLHPNTNNIIVGLVIVISLAAIIILITLFG
ncbi:izumo sperm-egg fusion protein 1 [Denticeps clupeoides]|uniref:izumo sperm-egg fusion protein 1 n=1 Tax=Denticeps clupeoides TaxID=299321 RepID=UPI0010A4A9AF|nr:izumo sperm-egg fusion protein 1 [Denticeps clupeoides]